MDKTLMDLYDESESTQPTDVKKDVPDTDKSQRDVSDEMNSKAEPNSASQTPERELIAKETVHAEVEPEDIEVADEASEAQEDEKSARSADWSGLTAAVEALNMKVQVLETSIRGDLDALRQAIPSLQPFESALYTLRTSLAANQRNEQILHDELEVARKDQYFVTVRPFLEFMVSHHADLLRMKQSYQQDREVFIQESNEIIYNDIVSMLDNYIMEMEGMLEQHGVEVLSCIPGEEYRPLEQRVIEFIPTNDIALNKTVFSAKSCAYRYNNRVLRKANVACYRYERQDDNTDASNPEKA